MSLSIPKSIQSICERSLSMQTLTATACISSFSGSVKIATKYFDSNNKLSENTIELISDVIAIMKSDIVSLEFLSVLNGPGSFTSIRVAISTFSGLARSLNIPLIGVSFREILIDFAYGEDVSICILAGKTQIVVAKGTDVIETIDLVELKGRILVDGDGEFRLDDSLFDIVKTDHENLPENVRRLDNVCDAVGRIAWRKFQAGDLTPAIPEYLELQNAK